MAENYINHVIGGNSRLYNSCKTLINNSIVYDRKDYLDWIDNIHLLKDKLNPSINHNFLVFASITNPFEDTEKIWSLNYELPKILLSLANKYKVKVVTFGTILENSEVSNMYVDSKKAYSKLLSDFDKKNYLHFRLHTLYGLGKPIEHMFLGQIYYSIKNKKSFIMSSGNQIRQYHHYNDIACIIENYLKNKNGIHDLTSLESIRLSEIAKVLFKEFFDINKVKYQKNMNLKNEIFKQFPVNKELNKFSFRDAKIGITQYFKEIL